MTLELDAMDFHDVIGCESVAGYVLRVRFDDGAERTIDFAPILIGPLFGPLQDPSLFRQVRVDADLGTLVWPTGADIAPGVLYDWPRHVDAIIRRRRQQWGDVYGDPQPQWGSREHFDSVLQTVAEANLEPYEADRLPEETDQEVD